MKIKSVRVIVLLISMNITFSGGLSTKLPSSKYPKPYTVGSKPVVSVKTSNVTKDDAGPSKYDKNKDSKKTIRDEEIATTIPIKNSSETYRRDGVSKKQIIGGEEKADGIKIHVPGVKTNGTGVENQAKGKHKSAKVSIKTVKNTKRQYIKKQLHNKGKKKETKKTAEILKRQTGDLLKHKNIQVGHEGKPVRIIYKNAENVDKLSIEKKPISAQKSRKQVRNIKQKGHKVNLSKKAVILKEKDERVNNATESNNQTKVVTNGEGKHPDGVKKVSKRGLGKLTEEKTIVRDVKLEAELKKVNKKKQTVEPPGKNDVRVVFIGDGAKFKRGEAKPTEIISVIGKIKKEGGQQIGNYFL